MSVAAFVPSVVEWGWAGRALHGGDESGDHHVVVPLRRGVLFAVIDGLGHGPEAALAAREAAAVLQGDPEHSPIELIQHCHEELRKTRGAVMSVARVDASDSTVTWCGVGNVEAMLLRAGAGLARRSESVVARGGVIGYRLPPLKETTVGILPRDTLVFGTDGVRSGFWESPSLQGDAPQRAADAILTDYGKDTDDALVLVARYIGAEP